MKLKRSLAGATLIGLALVSYAPATQGDFIWDDDMYVTQNPTLGSSDGLRRIWLEPGATPQYYPLVFTSFWVEVRAWGLYPAAFHWGNVLLHGMNAFLLWLVLRRLAVAGAWFAGALFAVHPVEAESVAWITERKSLLSGFLYGLAMLAYLRYALPDLTKTGQRGSWGWYALALVLFLGALFSKTVTCSLPAALVLILWWKRGKVDRKDWLALAPFFVLGLALGSMTVLMERYHVQAQGFEWSFSAVDRCLIAGRALWFYAGKLLWPTKLIFIYPRWSIDAHALWQYLFSLAALAVIVVLWCMRGRLGKGPLVAILFFAGTLVPALGFFNIYPQRFSFVADHFQYLASAGLFALTASTATMVTRWLPPVGQGCAAVAGGVLLLALATLTWQQGYVYRSQESLWMDTVVKNPQSWVAHCNVAKLLFEQGRLSEAEQHLHESLHLHPAPWEARCSLGLIQEKRGDLAAAEKEFSAALQVEPGYVPARSGLGRTLMQQGRLIEAVEQLTRAAADDPNSYGALESLGAALLQLARHEDAGAAYARAAKLAPGTADLHYGYGIVLFSQGDEAAAEAEFRMAARVDPGWPKAARRGAWMLATHPNAQVRNGVLAVRLARQACGATEYSEPLCLDTLAAAQAEIGQFAQAATTAQRALQSQAELSPHVVQQIEARMRLYQRKQVFRDLRR